MGLKIEFSFIPMPQTIIDDGILLEQCEFQLLMYLIRHQVGFGFNALRISDDELMNGRRNKDGSRKGKGCGLSRNSIKKGRELLAKRGWIKIEEDLSDKARPKRWYSVILNSDNDVSNSDNDVSNSDNDVSNSDNDVSNSDNDVLNSDTRSINRQVLNRKDFNTKEENRFFSIENNVLPNTPPSSFKGNQEKETTSNTPQSLTADKALFISPTAQHTTKDSASDSTDIVAPSIVEKQNSEADANYADKAFALYKEHFEGLGFPVRKSNLLLVFLSSIRTQDDLDLFDVVLSGFKNPANLDGLRRAFTERNDRNASTTSTETPLYRNSGFTRSLTLEMAIKGLNENEVTQYMNQFSQYNLTPEMFGRMGNGKWVLFKKYDHIIGL